MTPRRAFTVLVTAPNHLIGTKAQVDSYHAGTTPELPPWYGEWSDMLPEWELFILETPYDVGCFFRGAVSDPDTPRVGFLANSKMALSCGYAAGTITQTSRMYAARDELLGDTAREQEQTDFKQRKKTRKQTQTEVAANGEMAHDEALCVLPGVSPRTQRRDALLRTTTPVPQYGVCCPHCGRRVLNSQGLPLSQREVVRKGLAATCWWCNEPLATLARERDNVLDRDNPLWTDPSWQTYHYDSDGQRTIPWGTRPTSNPRYALGLLIGKRYKGMVDLYLCDEIHECKGKTTAIGRAFGALVHAAHRTVGLTGTLFGGKASDVFALLLRLGNVPVRKQWGWGGERRFIQDVGVVDEVTRTVERKETGVGHYSGKPTISTSVEERPGITAGLATILQNASISVLLKHMGFHLVDYHEDAVILPLPPDMMTEYRRLEDEGRKIFGFGGNDALSSYLQSTLCYPYQPWNPKEIRSEYKRLSYTPPAYDGARIMPHHTWLAAYCAKQIRQGRRVLIYCEHTGKDDLMPDVARKITHLAQEESGVTLRCAMLRSTTVAPGERRAWFAAREQDGTNVVLCHPKLVKTGLNLIGWPSIVVLEPVYSLFTLAQAKRRAYRPTQTQDCEVTHLAYGKTMSEKALSLVARKAAATAILNGDDLANGFMEIDAGMSLFKELAQMVTNEATEDDVDVHALFAAGAAALKSDLEAGIVGMVGAQHPVPVPIPPLDESVAPPTPWFGNVELLAAQTKTRRHKPIELPEGVDQLPLFD